MTNIAIVILNWNGLKYLQQFIPNVVKYSNVDTFQVDVIVADNGSTDNSIAWLSENYPVVKTILLDKNYGFTGGYNLALKQINSDYYVILNSDIEVKDGWLAPMIDFMESTPQAAACMPKLLSYHDKKIFEYAGAAGGFIDFLGYPFCRGRILNVIEEDKGQYNNALEIFWATGACMLVRSQQFWEAGGFDNDFFAHMEEIDLCWRLKRQGYSVWCIPQSQVFHVGGGTLAANNPRKVYFNHRNNLLMLLKNLSRTSLLPVLVFRLVLDVASALLYLISGKPRFTWAVVRAHAYFIRSFAKTVKKRRTFKHPKLSLYRNSIVFQFFFLNRKHYSDLQF
jgi:GT2 family glycosyltransferase